MISTTGATDETQINHGSMRREVETELLAMNLFDLE
jgi:hypothetical protein